MKKILVLGVSFDDAFGVGVTLRNLFSSIPPEQVCVADFSVTARDFPFAASLFNLSEDRLIQHPASSIQHPAPGTSDPSKGLKHLLLIPVLAMRKYLAYYYNNYIPYRLTSNLTAFIRAERPNYLYVVPYSRKMINLALTISQKSGIPLVTHIMDDFRRRSPKDLLYPLNEALMRKSIAGIVRKSYKCLSICESMSAEYERIFHCEFHPFHNPIRTDQFSFPDRPELKSGKDPVRIMYAGTIAENNIDALQLFAKVCERYSRHGDPMTFDIYSPTNPSNVFYQRLKASVHGCKYVTLKDKLSHSEIIPAMGRYHLLLLPLTFSHRYHYVIKYSFPTKVAEYMASGIPTLYLIPRGITLHDFILEHRFGFLIDQLEEETAEDFLSTLRETLRLNPVDERAREYSFSHFNITAVSERFLNLFSR